MKELKEAENIMKNVSLGSTYFDNLMLGADEDGISLNYSFRMNSFSYHIKALGDDIYEYSTDMMKENELEIDKGLVATTYSNKKSPIKQLGTLEEAMSHAIKAYSSSRLKSVKQFFEEEAEDFGNEKSSLKGFTKVFSDNFSDFMVIEKAGAVAIHSNHIKGAVARIGNEALITINGDSKKIKAQNDFDALESLFEESISQYIDKKIETKMDLTNYKKNEKKSTRKRKFH